MQQITKQQIIDILLSDKGSRHVILFDSTKQIRNFSENIGYELKRQPTFSLDMNVRYRVTPNMIQVNNTKIFFGLKKDELLLQSRYNEQEIFYYAEGNN